MKVIDADTIECVTPAYVPSSDPDLNATVADIEATKEKASKISSMPQNFSMFTPNSFS